MFHSYEMPAVGQIVRARSHGGELGRVVSIDWPMVCVQWRNGKGISYCAPEYLDPAPLVKERT